MDNVIDFINVNRDRYLDELKALPRHPEHQRAARARRRRASAAPSGAPTRCAASACRTSGSIETPGNPVVYGDWLGAPGAPTILFYGHYDVQPVDPLDLWESPPFEATIRDGEIYARGAADDKGQVFMHFKAIEAHLKQNGRLPVNIKFILEGEEEVGSVNLDDFVRATRTSSRPTSSSSPTRRCSPAACRRSATACAASSTSRSICAAAAPTCTPDRSAARSPIPAFVLAQMLAQMKDRGGRIKIPGFYDDVRGAAARRSGRRGRRCRSTRSSTGRTSASRSCSARPATRRSSATWARPTFEVNGLLSGFTGEGAKTVLPAVAMAKVSMRLVPNQDPGQDRASSSRRT